MIGNVCICLLCLWDYIDDDKFDWMNLFNNEDEDDINYFGS